MAQTAHGVSEENGQTLRISLGGASALTGHRQDARLVRIDAAGPAASLGSVSNLADDLSDLAFSLSKSLVGMPL
jgi:hypothetical protein